MRVCVCASRVRASVSKLHTMSGSAGTAYSSFARMRSVWVSFHQSVAVAADTTHTHSGVNPITLTDHCTEALAHGHGTRTQQHRTHTTHACRRDVCYSYCVCELWRRWEGLWRANGSGEALYVSVLFVITGKVVGRVSVWSEFRLV